MADDLSLLFKLRGDNSQLKGVVNDSRQVVNQLKDSFGPQLTQSVTVANQTFTSLGDNLQNFVTQRVPLVGGAVAQVTNSLKGLGGQGAQSQRDLKGIADSIQSIASQSGKTVPQITAFLGKFNQLATGAERNDAAFKFFGGSVDLIGNKTAKFLPQLEQTGAALAGVGGESVAAGASIASMAGPIGIAVVAVIALGTAAIAAGRELFNITKQAAEFQGKMFDLAQQTGLSVKTLSALEVGAKKTGGELGSITQAVVLFQRKLDDAQDPLSKTAEQFNKLGVATSDTETALRSAFIALAAMPEGFAQTNAAAELFGARGGKQVLAILKETNGDLDGTIKRLEQLGIIISEDDARAADIFNDQLAELEFQTRALTAVFARDLIPVITDLAKTTGELITTLRPLISILGSLTGEAARFTAGHFKALRLVIQAVTKDYVGLARAIKEAHDAQQINPITVPEIRPVPLPTAPTPLQAAGEEVVSADAVLAEVKRRAAQTNQALDEAFQRGRLNRQQQVLGLIEDNRKVLEADKARIDAQLTQKEQEIKALDEAARNRGEIVNRETEQYRAINVAVAKLQQERLDKENEFDVTSRALRATAAKERANATRSQLQNETDILIKALDNRIASTEAAIKRESLAEDDGVRIIERLEREKIDARVKALTDQKAVGFLTIQEQKDFDNQIRSLNQDRERLEDDQRARRLQREIEAAARNREALTANLDAIIQQEQIVGQRRIDTLKALAEQRVITEENAARQILAIQLSLLDDEIEIAQTKLTAAGAITDKNERVRVQTELNNQIKILTEQRISIQADGDREIEAGRQTDLQNERDYADELKEIKERIRDIERDTAQEVIRLMVIYFASRRDIIRARLQADLADENARHVQANETIDNLQQENRESKKTQEEKLTTERELNALREAEAERHRLAMQGIKDQAKQDDEEADPVGRFNLDTESLREFASVLEDSIVPLGEILRNTFSQVADAIGSVISQWVLLGETGPAVGRKILAAALANIAKEAAINAIKELALGFATLFFNPAESVAHFTAAGLWASIAGGAALAGRGVAGDVFKSKSAGAGGSRAGGNNELNPLNLARNAGPGAQQQIVPIIQPIVRVEIRPDGSKFADAVTAHYIDDHNNAGPMRDIRNNDGNLNRG